MKRHVALLCWVLMLAVPLTAAAEMRPVLKHRVGTPPFSVIEAMMRGNAQGVERAAQQPPPPDTAPALTWLADCDHRLYPGLVQNDPDGRVYAVCTLGNQLRLATGAIDFGVRVLHSPVLLITGQTDSEAIRLFETRPDGVNEEIRHDLASLDLPPPKTKMPPKSKNKGKKGKGRKSKATAAAKTAPTSAPGLPGALVERNVDYQVAQALRRYQDRVADGRLVVVGGIIDLANQYGEGKDRLFLININGETDPAKLRRSPHVVRLDPNQLKLLGRRSPPAVPSINP